MSDETPRLHLVNQPTEEKGAERRSARDSDAGQPCAARKRAAEAMLKTLYPPGTNPKAIPNPSNAFRAVYSAQADVEAVAMEHEIEPQRCSTALAMAATQLARLAVHFYEHGWVAEARDAHQASLNLRIAGHRVRGRK